MVCLIALGGAECVWDDLAAAEQLLGENYDVGAVNDVGAKYSGHLVLWATLHPEKFAQWQRQRELEGFNTDYCAVTRVKHWGPRIDKVVAEIWPGSSGLYVCQIAAINFGYDRIITCGIPMNPMPHFFSDEPWDPAPRYRRGWQEACEQPELRGKVRSMSGWTAELLGRPTPEWLTE